MLTANNPIKVVVGSSPYSACFREELEISQIEEDLLQENFQIFLENKEGALVPPDLDDGIDSFLKSRQSSRNYPSIPTNNTR